MKRESDGVEKLKADLESSSVSLKAALSANINLAETNKDLEEKLERANAEVSLHRERCSIVEQKEADTNRRANSLHEEVVELEREVTALKADHKEDRCH